MTKHHNIKLHSILSFGGILLVFLTSLAFCLSMVNTMLQRRLTH